MNKLLFKERISKFCPFLEIISKFCLSLHSYQSCVPVAKLSKVVSRAFFSNQSCVPHQRELYQSCVFLIFLREVVSPLFRGWNECVLLLQLCSCSSYRYTALVAARHKKTSFLRGGPWLALRSAPRSPERAYLALPLGGAPNLVGVVSQ